MAIFFIRLVYRRKKHTSFQAQGHFIKSLEILLNKFGLQLFWRKSFAWSSVYQIFISFWKHNFTLQTTTLVSICRVIAESFLFASLKLYSLETQGLIKMQDKIWQREVISKVFLYFFQMCGQSNKCIVSSCKSFGSMLFFLLRSYWKLSAITLQIANNEVICKKKLYFQQENKTVSGEF